MGGVITSRIEMLEQRLACLRRKQTELRQSSKGLQSAKPSTDSHLLSIREEIAEMNGEIKLLRSLQNE